MLKRILTAIVGIPVAVFLVTKGGWMFGAAMLLLAGVAWHEYEGMARHGSVTLYKLTSGLPALLLVLAACLDREDLLLPILTLAVLAVLFEGLYRRCHYEDMNWVENTSVSLAALFYTGLLFAHIPLLREYSSQPAVWGGLSFSRGELALWMALLGTWSSDTFAYFFGRAFGRHPFCVVSPKKSMEGAVAGFIFALAVTAGVAYCGLAIPMGISLLLGLCVAFCAPVGDLVESMLKRSFDIKDSGSFFPGHGGVLDRFDSLLFVIPVIYYVLKLFEV